MTTKEKDELIKRALQVFKVKDRIGLKSREQRLFFGKIKKLKDDPEAKLVELKKLLGNAGNPLKPLDKLKAFSLILSPYKSEKDLESVSKNLKISQAGLEYVKDSVKNNYDLAEIGQLFAINLALSSEDKEKIKALNTNDEINSLGKYLLAKLTTLVLLQQKIVDVIKDVDNRTAIITQEMMNQANRGRKSKTSFEEEKQEMTESSALLASVPSVIDATRSPVIGLESLDSMENSGTYLNTGATPQENESGVTAPKKKNFFDKFKRAGNKERLSRSEKVKRSRNGKTKKFKQAESIISDTYNGEEAQQTLADYKREYSGIDQLVTDDIFSERAFKLDLVKPELISEPYLDRYFQTVVESYAEYNRDSIEEGYGTDPSHWFDSEANRGRMVLIEATNENLQELAEATINASPLERVVAVGLDETKNDEFKAALLDSWERKINSQSNPEEYREKVLDALRKYSTTKDANSLEEFSIKDLSGPHAHTPDKNISYESLKISLGDSFSSKLDEIVLYGSDNNMANQVSELAHKAEVKQYVAIKSSGFTSEDSPFWIGAFNQEVTNPIQLLTSSKDSRDIFVKSREGKNETTARKGAFSKIKNFFWPGFDTEVIASKTNNFNYNPRFESIFDNDGLQEKDKEYLKALFAERSLYPTNLSPELYSSTITKTQSGINGEGAVVVGNALEEGNFGRQVATAKGVLFAVNATMFDTANDINLESQDKMLSYKKTFQNLIQFYKEDKKASSEEAFELAAKDLVTIYSSIEKRNAITENEKRGKLNRIYTLENANKTNKKNRTGINLLLPLPIGVGYGAAATVTGLTLAITGFAASIAFPVVGAVIFVTTTALLATSLRKQKKANADNLARWHRSSARAHASMRKAQDKRENFQKDIIEKLRSGISLNDIISRQNSMEAGSDQDFNVTPSEINAVLEDPKRPDTMGELLISTGVSPKANAMQSIKQKSPSTTESLNQTDLSRLSQTDRQVTPHNSTAVRETKVRVRRAVQRV